MTGWLGRYFASTRHPAPCLLFVLALLAVYEGAMAWLATPGPPPRAGVDSWLRLVLGQGGWDHPSGPALAVLGICLVWALLSWPKEPPELLTALPGMVVESVVLALVLWAIGLVLPSLWDRLGTPLHLPPAAARAITYVGSGLYEETVFRLLLFGLLALVMRVLFGKSLGVLIALVLSAALFALAHHVGASGEPWHWRVFLFRLVAGMYFGLLLIVRGFGIAVGAHATYNVLVGLAQVS